MIDMEIILEKPLASNSPAEEFDVRQMKKALNRLGYYTPFAKTGITGIPDAELFRALKAFQREQNLPPTGTANPDDEIVKAINHATAKKREGSYIWHTVGDDRVRGRHAALEGRVQDWEDSPDPGEEFNCRCWAESVEKNMVLFKTIIEV